MEQMTFEEACSAVADTFEANPETWARGALAFNASGSVVMPEHSAACKWCARGGLLAAGVPTTDLQFLSPFGQALGFVGSIEANDSGGRKVAIRMLRMASGEIK